MRIYLTSGDVVAAETDLTVTQLSDKEHGLLLLGVPDGAAIRYWHPQEEEWYDCRWDLEHDSPTYGQLYYEGQERGGESALVSGDQRE